jgi:hypothetical protein
MISGRLPLPSVGLTAQMSPRIPNSWCCSCCKVEAACCAVKPPGSHHVAGGGHAIGQRRQGSLWRTLRVPILKNVEPESYHHV